jgi:hypothetical protein
MIFAATEVGCSSKCSVVDRLEQLLYGHREGKLSQRSHRLNRRFNAFVADFPLTVVNDSSHG